LARIGHFQDSKWRLILLKIIHNTTLNYSINHINWGFT